MMLKVFVFMFVLVILCNFISCVDGDVKSTLSLFLHLPSDLRGFPSACVSGSVNFCLQQLFSRCVVLAV